MALIIKEPKHPVAFPPADHLRAYQVRDGDNWWTLQKQFGLRDPWSLIRYNFATDDPAEVNWYLREYVGCVLKTADGKNYRFSNAAKPGLIYLPRHNFKHGIGGGGGAGANLPRQDRAAKNTVLWALGLSAVSSLQFEVNGFQVWPNDYHRVRRLIQEGEIVVAHDPSLGESAMYYPTTDTIYLGSGGDRALSAIALVIHEITHAALDAGAVRINDGVSEMMGYIAQMLFTMTREPRSEPPIREKPAEKEIFLPAWRLAARVRAKQLNHPTPQLDTTEAEDRVLLMRALVAHEDYKKQFARADANYNGESGYNGVKGWVYHWVE